MNTPLRSLLQSGRIGMVAATVMTMAALQVGAAPAAPGGWEKVTGKRILYFTKSSGFEHSVVKRGAADQLSHSERILTELGIEQDSEKAADYQTQPAVEISSGASLL